VITTVLIPFVKMTKKKMARQLRNMPRAMIAGIKNRIFKI